MAAIRSSRKAIVSGAFHHHLLTDDVRVNAYAEAVAATVRAGDVVADLGAGSGVLAGLAARAGASRVFAVEHDPHAAASLRTFVERNGLTRTIEIMEGAAEDWIPPVTVDVVLCEMIETGLMNEDQVRVMNRVARWPTRPRAVVPQSASLRLLLARMPEERAGFRFLMPHFERTLPVAYESLTAEAEYARADFREPREGRVDGTATLQAERAGEANCVVLVTRVTLAPGVEAAPSSDHASPLVLPLDDPVAVAAGARYSARVRYELGSTTGNVLVDLNPE